ncbi:metalloregulator ArsR/SmtB family transcription factor [Paracoccus sp. MBLB3053]|uniref:Metalloregulator ArsR/SmtB family transcription factor n=1 Tax=Paracoccus aurantius TaxID=3073814 RepID=A0ABU2HZC6_9RHOB|nr:metalloregulator ArsR/SmtB family transcription factor [Paracoccus sp. MBLB3053]MDS9470102.1 metalloregulator ArsR/SmtB family transcription factor [Paracoccus sp. MBLB3053]
MAKHDARLDLLFTSLGDPTRRAILARLARGEASVTDLASAHDMALPSFMKHLRKLEEAGLISTTKEGRIRSCALSPEAFAPVEEWLSEQRAIWNDRLDRLDDYVGNLMRERMHGTRPED